MNVLVFTTVFPNSAQPYFGLFVYERIRHAAQNCAVRVVAPVSWMSRLRHRGISSCDVSNGLVIERPTFYYVPGVFKVLDALLLCLSVLPRMSRMRRAFAFDLIDAHFGYPEGVAAVLLGWWFRSPVVLTLRGSEVVIVRSRPRRAVLGWALRRATRIVTVSGELAQLAVDLGAAPNRVTVIRNGVDCQLFAEGDRIADRRGLGVSGPEPLVVAVGHLVPLKGFHRLINALCAALPKLPSTLRVVIVGGRSHGSGTYPQQLLDLADALGVSRRVKFAGAQPPEQVARWLRAADVFVLASDREGCPNVVLEAMASGTPVVAAAVGEVRSLVPEWAGIVYDPKDSAALPAALVNALDRSWDRARIRRHAEAQTWTKVAERVYDEWTLAVGVVDRPYPTVLAS